MEEIYSIVLHYYEHYPIPVAVALILLAYQIVQGVIWRHYLKYPPTASLVWLPVIGHLPLFALAPRWFIMNAYKRNGKKPFFFDLLAHRFIICGPDEAQTMFRAKEEMLEMKSGVMQLMNFDLTLGTDMFKPVNMHGTTAQIITLRKKFTPNMNDHIRPMVDECLKVANKYYESSASSPLSSMSSKKMITIDGLDKFVLDMVTAAASRALLGESLSSNLRLAKELREYSGKVSEINELSAVLPRSMVSKAAEKVQAAKESIGEQLLPEIRRRRQFLKLSSKIKDEEENNHTDMSASNNDNPPKSFLDYLLLQTEVNGEPLSESRLVEIVCVMVFAAYDTTTHAVVHLLYDIAAREKVRNEIFKEQREIQEKYNRKMAKNNAHDASDPIGFINVEAINDKVVLESALRESQRLSGGAFTPVRMVMTDNIKCKDGTKLPKGTLMALSPWLVHFDPELYPNPYDFQLDRFAGEGKAGPSARKFLSFGGGRHQCPGRFFATMEIKCIVSALLSKYDISSLKLAPYDDSNGNVTRKSTPVTMSLLDAPSAAGL